MRSIRRIPLALLLTTLMACDERPLQPWLACEDHHVPQSQRSAAGPGPLSVERAIVSCSASGRPGLTYLIEPPLRPSPHTAAQRTSTSEDQSAVRVTRGRVDAQQRLIMDVGSGSTVRIDLPPERGQPVTADVVFYLERSSHSCGTRAELNTLALVTAGNSEWRAEQSATTGICLPSDIRPLPPSPPRAADIVDSLRGLHILDYRVTREQALQLVAFAEARAQPELVELVVLEYSRAEGARSLASFTGPEVLPSGCGQYLLAARLLPTTTRIALAYAHGRLRMVDYAVPTRPPELLHDNLANAKDLSFTCEGGGPSFTALRREFRVDSVTVDGKTLHTLRWTLPLQSGQLELPVQDLAQR